MNEQYTHTIDYQGRTYRYDPDRDIFYCQQPISKWDQYAWIAVTLVLAAIALYFEFSPIR